MKQLILTVIWIIFWIGLGVTFEHFKVIVSPAWWATFGAIMAIILFEAQNLLCGTQKSTHNTASVPCLVWRNITRQDSCPLGFEKVCDGNPCLLTARHT